MERNSSVGSKNKHNEDENLKKSDKCLTTKKSGH